MSLSRHFPSTVAGRNYRRRDTPLDPIAALTDESRRNVIPYLFSREDAAAYLGISGFLIDKLRKAGQLATVEIGDRRLYRRCDLEAIADTQVDTGYALRLPQTAGECHQAIARLLDEAGELQAQAETTRYPAYAERRRQAADAYLALARWFRWNAGEEEDAVA